MDFKEIVWKVVEWMHLALDRDHWPAFVSTIMNLWIPQKAGNFWTLLSNC
jgi:hypothetical protein